MTEGRGVGLLLALRLSEARGCLGHILTSLGGGGLREAGCDLIFLMVLSLVLLGCGGGPSPPPHQNGVCWGIGST